MANRDELPEDIQEEYYEPERRERTGVAWLLAFATLVVTILLATGLFFAGRWTYRQIAGTDEEPQAPSTAQNEERRAEEAEEEERPSEADETEQPDTGAENGEQEDGVVAGDQAEGALPDTGPAETLSAFVAVSILGYLIHRVYIRRTQN